MVSVSVLGVFGQDEVENHVERKKETESDKEGAPR
jgi:hypothetical protein